LVISVHFVTDQSYPFALKELPFSNFCPVTFGKKKGGGNPMPYLADVVRFTTFLTLHPKPIDVLAVLSRDYLRGYGVTSVQLFSLLNNNLLELHAEFGTPSKFTAPQLSQRKLEELESLISTENICRDIALNGCICDPSSSLTVTPFSMGTSLYGFFLVEWEENREITKQALEVVTLYSALSSLYFTHSKFFALEQDQFNQGVANAPTMSDRQIQILRGMVDGKTNHELATDLGFSVSTIRHETMAIFRALGVSDRKEAAKAAQLMELI
jgi:DNA-binding CsgD family transcriptional regulator